MLIDYQSLGVLSELGPGAGTVEADSLEYHASKGKK